MKRCNQCLEVRRTTAFYKRADGTGFRSVCIACWKIASLRWYPKTERVKTTPEQKKENVRLALKRYRNKPSSKAKHAAYSAMRRCHKLRACPKWLNAEQKAHIKAYYEFARDLGAQFGQKLDIDHVIPLKGKDVCGLHVPWNLQVMEHGANMKKGTRYEA